MILSRIKKWPIFWTLENRESSTKKFDNQFYIRVSKRFNSRGSTTTY